MLGHSRSHGDIIRRQRELPAHLDTHHVICRQDRPRALPAGKNKTKEAADLDLQPHQHTLSSRDAHDEHTLSSKTFHDSCQDRNSFSCQEASSGKASTTF